MEEFEISELISNEELANFVKTNYPYFDNEWIADRVNRRFGLDLSADDIRRVIRAIKDRAVRNGGGKIPRKYPILLRKHIQKKGNVIIIGKR